MTVTSIIRQAGGRCDNEYARSIAILTDWSSPKAWGSAFAPGENASCARSAISVLRKAQARNGGTHFVLATNGVVRSVLPAAGAA